MNFLDFSFDQRLQQALDELKFETPTEIQLKAIPIVMKGQDLAGLAQTGTGKTAAFLLPLMQRILLTQKLAIKVAPSNEDLAEKPSLENEDVQAVPSMAKAFDSWKPGHFVLILVPTRELAEQVQQNCQSLGRLAGLKSAVIYGGSSYDRQKEALKTDPEFVIATPGRFIDLFKDHFIDLKQVKAVVFDEADRMFDMGFKDDMKFILRRLPPERQFLVFSATLNFEVLHAAYEFGAQPIEVNVSKDKATADHVKDSIFHVGSDEKPRYLLSLLKHHQPKQTIVFSNFKRDVERLALFLSKNDYPAVGISSLLSQAQRNRVMEQFKSESTTNILVATDVAARGLDIAGVDLVINYDLPDDPENYVHRIGRTGRAGKEGQAFSLVCEKDIESLPRVEEYVHRKLEVGWLESDQLLTDFKPVPRDSFSGPSKKRASSSRTSSGPARSYKAKSEREERDSKKPLSQSRRPERPRPDLQKKAVDTIEGASEGNFKRRPRQPQHKRRNQNRVSVSQVQRSAGEPAKSASVKAVAKNSLGARIKGFFKKMIGSQQT